MSKITFLISDMNGLIDGYVYRISLCDYKKLCKIYKIYNDAEFRKDFNDKSYIECIDLLENDEVKDISKKLALLLIVYEKMEHLHFNLLEMLEKSNHESWTNFGDATEILFEYEK